MHKHSYNIQIGMKMTVKTPGVVSIAQKKLELQTLPIATQSIKGNPKTAEKRETYLMHPKPNCPSCQASRMMKHVNMIHL